MEIKISGYENVEAKVGDDEKKRWQQTAATRHAGTTTTKRDQH